MDITQQIIWATIESTYGVDPGPNLNDAILVEGFTATRSNLKLVERNPIEASKGTRQKIFAASLYDITFSMEVKGSGTVAVAPELSVPIQACAVLETIVPATSVAYTPIDTGHKSVTVYRYIDGKLQAFSGLRGSFAYKANVHEIAKIDFTMTGHMVETDAAIGGATYDTTIPSPLVGVQIRKDAVALPGCSGLSFDNSSEIKIPTDMAVYDGFGEVNLAKRNPKGTLTVEDTLIATRNWKGILEANTLMALQIDTYGSGAGNQYGLTIPYASLIGDPEGENENKVTRALEFEAHPSAAGQDDWSLIFT